MEGSKSAKLISSYRPSYFQKYRKNLSKITGSTTTIPEVDEKLETTKKQSAPSPRKTYPSLTIETDSKQMQFSARPRPAHRITFGLESPATVTPKQTPKVTPTLTPKQTPKQTPKSFKDFGSEMVKSSQGGVREKEGVQQIEELVEEIERLKKARGEVEQKIQERRGEVQRLKRAIDDEDNPQNQAIDYAEKIVEIETMMKYKKNMHEEEINVHMKERKEMQQHNSTLLREVEALEKERNELAEYQKSAIQKQSLEQLQSKISRIKRDITDLQRQQVDLQGRINNSEEIRAMGLQEFQKYAALYVKQLLGREVADARDYVKQTTKPGRWAKQIGRKRALLKEKRIENNVRRKALLELERVAHLLRRDIEPMKHLSSRIQ